MNAQHQSNCNPTDTSGSQPLTSEIAASSQQHVYYLDEFNRFYPGVYMVSQNSTFPGIQIPGPLGQQIPPFQNVLVYIPTNPSNPNSLTQLPPYISYLAGQQMPNSVSVHMPMNNSFNEQVFYLPYQAIPNHSHQTNSNPVHMPMGNSSLQLIPIAPMQGTAHRIRLTCTNRGILPIQFIRPTAIPMRRPNTLCSICNIRPRYPFPTLHYESPPEPTPSSHSTCTCNGNCYFQPVILPNTLPPPPPTPYFASTSYQGLNAQASQRYPQGEAPPPYPYTQPPSNPNQNNYLFLNPVHNFCQTPQNFGYHQQE